MTFFPLSLLMALASPMGELAEHACAVTWWAEKIPESCIVWGWKIFQWGRLAKVLGFVGGLVILVDIVGKTGSDPWPSRAEIGSNGSND